MHVSAIIAAGGRGTRFGGAHPKQIASLGGRSILQRSVDAFLESRGEALDAVILLDVPREESIARLALRAAEQGRSDDTDEAIAHRLDIYEKETAPIIEVYSARGIVDRIDGVGSLEEITERIASALAARGLRSAASAA